ncbi:MAG: histidine kinase [Omnitrophica WOR_2 bacterium SM23_72]|nr:MAG: histidine kinase [Omnitrophica WOR_2 bacterium SM23_72]
MDKKKILIIDDEEAFTRMIKLNLEATGLYEVSEENRGTQGVAAAKAVCPDLILLDIIMPDLDGMMVARNLKDDPATKDIPVVFLTVVVQKKETEGSSSIIGGYPFIAKPVNTQELIDCLGKYIK